MRKLVILNSAEISPSDALIPLSPPLLKGGMILGEDNDLKSPPPVPPFCKGGLGGISLPNSTTIPFSNAKSLLGNEYPFAIYDMRAENGIHFNLEAFAIVAGAIQRGGTLYLLCDDWGCVENTVDFDSLRWNDNRAIATPKFWVFFKALVEKYRFEYLDTLPAFSISPARERSSTLQLNAAQQFILKKLPLAPADIHLITAPRGRGKSTLSGKLAEMIAAEHSVIITARSRAALPNFWRQIENEKVTFFAPDRLIQSIDVSTSSTTEKNNLTKSWLFIDEAASLPLPMLQKLCSAFDKVVMTTTTQNYEGTGRGFELKLPKMLAREFRHWTLSQPLRWNENDPLERFVNELLLNEEIPPSPPLLKGGTFTPFMEKEHIHIPLLLKGNHKTFPLFHKRVLQKIPPFYKGGLGGIKTELEGILDFYNLLSLAHYKTTPSDLRRLFDGENQQLFEIRENQQLIAGAWGIFEGGLGSELAQAIWRGERRPKGNLLAQYLCFQGNFPLACQLRSLRISRIAVAPEMQGKGYGKRLISKIILQNSKQNAPLDFLSVSFGMSDELLNFWQQCGFRQVAISQNPEASSGLLSAMMIYPISEQGKAFAARAAQQFLLNQRLQKNHEIQPLTQWDRQNLQGFMHASRTFSAALPSLIRLAQSDDRFAWLGNYLNPASIEKSAIKWLKEALKEAFF